MRSSRRFRRSLSRLILAGAFAAIVWVPTAVASNVVELHGQLVPVSQVAAQPQVVANPVAHYTSSGDVVIGSRLVSTASTGRIVGVVGTAVPAATAASSTSFDWRDTVLGIAAFAACILAVAYILRRRMRLTPA
jgi:hypothetical protein